MGDREKTAVSKGCDTKPVIIVDSWREPRPARELWEMGSLTAPESDPPELQRSRWGIHTASPFSHGYELIWGGIGGRPPQAKMQH